MLLPAEDTTLLLFMAFPSFTPPPTWEAEPHLNLQVSSTSGTRGRETTLLIALGKRTCETSPWSPLIAGGRCVHVGEVGRRDGPQAEV